MPVRPKKKWTPDSRGRYPRDLGYKRNANGKLVPHRFYLGSDLTEAQRRNIRLEELWECIDREQGNREYKPEWNSLTLMIGQEIAKGNYKIVVFRKNNPPDSYARYIHRLSRAYPMVLFVPEPTEEESYKHGADVARSKGTSAVASRIREFREDQERRLLNVGAITPGEDCACDETLHEAFGEYVKHITDTENLPGTDGITDYGHMKIKNVERLKERHPNIPLSSLQSFDAVQGAINLWRNRPMVKNSNPPKPITKKTAEHHIAELMRFFRWLNRSSSFDWRKPNDFDELERRVKETPQEKQSRNSHTQVATYHIDELKLLNEYATPLERLLLLLGLNCGFGAAEQGRLTDGYIRLDQYHRNADTLHSLYEYESSSDDSYIHMARPKTGVYGEWLLWPQTAKSVKWGLDRAKKIENASAESLLLLTDRGKPFFKQTTGGNRSQNFSRRWADLTKRVKADYPEFPALSFGKLRKTAGNLIRQVSDGEIAGVFLCHGTPVRTDNLIDLYTNRPFSKVFEALRELEQRLKLAFDAAPEDLTVQPRQQYTGQKTVMRVVELHNAGTPIRLIAEKVGLSPMTVRRHIKGQQS